MSRLKDLFIDKSEELSIKKYNKNLNELNADELVIIYKESEKEVGDWLSTQIDKERERIKYGKEKGNKKN
jgi:hypothetical protein